MNLQESKQRVGKYVPLWLQKSVLHKAWSTDVLGRTKPRRRTATISSAEQSQVERLHYPLSAQSSLLTDDSLLYIGDQSEMGGWIGGMNCLADFS
jgi:hypothetical protein